MSKRQIRLNDKDQIRIRIASFIGQEINIVLQDNMVFLGILKAVSESEITITNMRRKNMILNLDKISELYIDTQDAC